MRRIPEAELLDIALRILAAEGAPPAEASRVARHLVDANLKGHDSHGVGMLETYASHARLGTLKPAMHGRTISDAPRPPQLPSLSNTPRLVSVANSRPASSSTGT